MNRPNELERDLVAWMEAVAPHSSRAVRELSPIERAILAIGAWELIQRIDIP